jgi:hypothetical protein
MIIKQRSLSQDKKTTYFSCYAFLKERICRFMTRLWLILWEWAVSGSDVFI